MGRRLLWGLLVLAIVLIGIGGYEALRGSAAKKSEITMTGRK